MRFRTHYLIAIVLVLAALPAQAQVQSFALTNGPGRLIDSFIAAGYGSDSLYQVLVNIAAESNPSVTFAGALPESFLQTLHLNCGAGTQVKTTPLSAYANLPATAGGVLVSTDCTVVQSRFLNGAGQTGAAGTSTLAFIISGVSAPAAIVSSATPFYVWAPNGDYGCPLGEDATCHHVFAIAYAPQGASQTFVLSNEGGHLIASLVAAGYGNYNLYDALVAIQQNTDPGITGVISIPFINSLAGCSAAHPVFTTQLRNVTGSVAISDDCSVASTSLQGSSFTGQPGTTTGVYVISGVGPATAVSSTSSTPLGSWTQNVAVGSSTATVTYNAFAILYTPGSTPPPATPVPSTLWLTLAGLGSAGAATWLRSRFWKPAV
ncbi:MAG: hypothetical protein ABSE42_10065 [Bryobacteraceae bacterium]|jgi:hypothetical protein